MKDVPAVCGGTPLFERDAAERLSAWPPADPEIGEANKNGTWGVAESTTTAAASLKSGNGVIKATGDNAGIAMLVAVVAIAGTMGVAVRKSRDAE